MLKNAGCDFVLFDTEHSGFHHETIKSVLRYFEAARLPAIVRVPSKEYHHIARAADMGAEGIMLPMVNDAKEARHILDCMKYVPAGPARRGAGRGARPLPGRRRAWTSSPPPTRAPPSSPRSRPAPASRTPTRSRRSTASTASGSAISTSRRRLGIPGQFEHKDFLDAIDAVVHACRKHGKATGRLVPDVGHRRRLQRQGLRLHLLLGRRLGLPGGGEGRRRRHPRGLRGRQVTRFKVALSGDFRKADGSPTYPSFDLVAADRGPERRAGLCRRGGRRHAGRGPRRLRRADPAGAQVHRRQRARRRQARGRGPLRRRLRQRRRPGLHRRPASRW